MAGYGIPPIYEPYVNVTSNTDDGSVLGRPVSMLFTFYVDGGVLRDCVLTLLLPGFTLSSSDSEYIPSKSINSTLNATYLFNDHLQTLAIEVSDSKSHSISDWPHRTFVSIEFPLSVGFFAPNSSVSSDGFRLSISSSMGQLDESVVGTICYGFCDGDISFSSVFIGDSLDIVLTSSYSEDLIEDSILRLVLSPLALFENNTASASVYFQSQQGPKSKSVVSGLPEFYSCANDFIDVRLPFRVNATQHFQISVSGFVYKAVNKESPLIKLKSLSSPLRGSRDYYMPTDLLDKINFKY